MKLYYSKGACSLSVRILLNELNIPCQFVSVDLTSGTTSEGTPIASINPSGAIPVLVLDDGRVMTQNASLHQYLAEHANATHLLPAVGDPHRYDVLQAESFVSADLHSSCFSPLFHPAVPGEVKEQIFKPALRKKLAILEKTLQKQEYVAGHTFSIADSLLFVVLGWLKYVDMDIKEWPALSDYCERVRQRPSVAKSLEQEFGEV